MIEYPKDFLEFWNAYPRRVAKLAAFKEWQKAVSLGVEAHEIINAAKKYKNWLAQKDAKTWRPEAAHPSSWLHQGRWEDELEVESEITSDRNSQWKARVGAWRKSKFWPEMWGPKPGESGCQCPQELLAH